MTAATPQEPLTEYQHCKTLLLFVHGFGGSSESFSSFPLELLHSLRTRYSIKRLECRILPSFDSKGENFKQVNHLCNWLLMNAAYPEFDSVIIIAHSMGGLLAVDGIIAILIY